MSRTVQPLFILAGNGHLASPRAAVGQHQVMLSKPQPMSTFTRLASKVENEGLELALGS